MQKIESVVFFPAGTQHLYNIESMSMQRHGVASTLIQRCINVMCSLGSIWLLKLIEALQPVAFHS